jgi:hypothetical protein
MVGGKQRADQNITQAVASIKKRRILHGEWVVAKDSIPYAYRRLLAYFIAFDITDDGHFVSRIKVHRIMHGSTSR